MLSSILKDDIKSIGASNLGLNIITNFVFLFLGEWDITVLIGSAFGYFLSMLNFYMLSKAVEKAVDKDPKISQGYMQQSYLFRMLILGVGLYITATVNSINWISACIALFFTRISITIITHLRRKEEQNGFKH